jgi:hypothetical protein
MQRFLAIFHAASFAVAQYNTNTKTSEKSLHNSYIYKNPSTPQGKDLSVIYIHLQTSELKGKGVIPFLLEVKKYFKRV